MSVRKLFLSASLVSVFVAGSLILTFAQGKDDDPFFDHGAKGETIKVLPAPALLHSQNPNLPSVAEPQDEATVYPAGIGSGNLLNHGGPQIADMKFVPVFWNGTVADSAANGGKTLQSYIEDFITNFSGTTAYANDANSDYTIVQQYGAHDAINYRIGVNSPISVVDPSNPLGTPVQTLTDTNIQDYLVSRFGAGLQTDTIYGVYFPDGTTVKLNGASCTNFCGYHNHFVSPTGKSIKYAVFPYLNCSACSMSGHSVADMLTVVTSHEVREAVTDPELNAWFDRRGYEADDKCAWQHLYNMTNGGYFVQPEYSNGGTVTRSGFTAPYPGPGCIVPGTPSGGGGGGGGNGHGHGHLTTNGRGGGGQ